MSETPYHKVCLSAEIELTAPMHCADGATMEKKDWLGSDAKGEYASVYRDHRGRPTIPASTLRGSLRARCAKPETLFGTAKGGSGQIGLLRLYDAPLIHAPEGLPDDNYYAPDKGTSLRHGVAIDPVTRTADDHKLFTREYVAAGSRFQLRIEADRLTREQLARVLGLLLAWGASSEAALGKAKSRGWGGFTLAPDSLRAEGLTTGQLETWLNGPEPVLPRRERIPLPEAEAEAVRPGRIQRWTYRLRSTSPLLVHSPAHDKKRDNETDLIATLRDHQGRYLLPGSSLAGVVRAHCRRILASIAHHHQALPPDQSTKLATPLLDTLFGHARQQSRLHFGDATAEYPPPNLPPQAGGGINQTCPNREHEQHFVAIDRFTGGAKKGALFSVRAAPPTEWEGTLALNAPADNDWWKGLLVLALRDAVHGLLFAGSGRAHGHGQLRLLSFEGPDGKIIDLREQLRAWEQSGQARDWIDLLHQHIAAQARQITERPLATGAREPRHG